MVRFLCLACGVAWLFLIPLADSRANPPEDLKNTLAIQKALMQARHHLYSANPGKAVEILEEQLPRINGHTTYLLTLREAYRSHIQNLWLSKKGALARKYLERLCVLDPDAANDPVLSGNYARDKKPETPSVQTPAPLPVQPSVVSAEKGSTAAPAATVAPMKIILPEATPGQTLPALAPRAPLSTESATIRAKLDDPFDLINQRHGGRAGSLSQQLQTQGEAEFARQHYSDARKCFEKAFQADPHTMDATREPWAYCILHYVGDKVQQPGISGDQLEELRRFVQSALTMSPKLGDSGQRILRDIDNRGKELTRNGAEEIPVRHLGKNTQGWHTAETAHFRVWHQNQAQDFVARVARMAEKTRLEMFRKWFDHDGVRWDTKCDVYLHATVEDYSRATGAASNSPGHASIGMEENKVVSRRIDLHSDQNGLLEAYLPRETTHVVMAGMLGSVAVPRWADVGIAVLTETPSYELGQHRRNLANCYQEKSQFSARELLQLPDYPDKNRIKAFYAQSIVLVEFLAGQRGTKVFTEFLRDGAGDGYELALRRHYGWNFSDLEAHWTQYVHKETTRIAQAR